MPHLHIGDMWLILTGLVHAENPELSKKLLSHARRSFLSALGRESLPDYIALYRLRLADVYKQWSDSGRAMNEITDACSILPTPRSVPMEPITPVVRVLAERNIPRQDNHFEKINDLLKKAEGAEGAPTYYMYTENFTEAKPRYGKLASHQAYSVSKPQPSRGWS
jgi:hypothetical protein